MCFAIQRNSNDEGFNVINNEFNYESITMIEEDLLLLNFFHNKKDYFHKNKNLAVIIGGLYLLKYD